MDATAASPSHPRRGTVAAMRQRYSSSPTTVEPLRRKPLMIPKPHHVSCSNNHSPMSEEGTSLKESMEVARVRVGEFATHTIVNDTPKQIPPATEEIGRVSTSDLGDQEAVINPVAVYLNVVTANIPRSNSWNGPLSPPSRKHRSPRHHLRNVSPRSFNEPSDATTQVISSMSEPVPDSSVQAAENASIHSESMEQEDKAVLVVESTPTVPPVPRTARLSSAKVRRSRSVSIPRKLPQSETAHIEMPATESVVADPLRPDSNPNLPTSEKNVVTTAIESTTASDASLVIRSSLPTIPRNTSLKHWSRRQQQSKVGKSLAPSDSKSAAVAKVLEPTVVDVSGEGYTNILSEGAGDPYRPAVVGVDVTDILASKRAWMMSRGTKPNRTETRPRTMSEPNLLAMEAPMEKKSETCTSFASSSHKVNPIKAEIDFKAGKRALLALQKAKMPGLATPITDSTLSIPTVVPTTTTLTIDKRNPPDPSQHCATKVTPCPLRNVNPVAALEARTTISQSEPMKAADATSLCTETVPALKKVNPTKSEADTITEKRARSAFQIKASKKSAVSPVKLEKPTVRSSSVPSQRPPPLVIERTVSAPKNSSARLTSMDSSQQDESKPTASDLPPQATDHNVISLSWSLADKRNKAKQLISSRRSWGGTSSAGNVPNKVEGTISARPSTDSVICASSSSFDTSPSLCIEQSSATATSRLVVGVIKTAKDLSRDEHYLQNTCANTISTVSVSTDISAGPVESCGSSPVADVPQGHLVLQKTNVTGIEHTLQSHLTLIDVDYEDNIPSHSILYDDTGEVVYMSPNRVGVPLEDKTSALRADSPVEEDDILDDDSTVDALVDDILANRRPDKTEAVRSASPLMETICISKNAKTHAQSKPLIVDNSFDFRPILDESKETSAIVESSWDTTKVLFNEYEKKVDKSNPSFPSSNESVVMIAGCDAPISSSEFLEVDSSIPPSDALCICNNSDASLDPLGWPIKPDGLVTHSNLAVPSDDEANVESDDDVENLLPTMKSHDMESQNDYRVAEVESPVITSVLSKEERIQAYSSIAPDDESSVECDEDCNAGEDKEEEIAYEAHDGDDDSCHDISFSIGIADFQKSIAISSNFASFKPIVDIADTADANEPEDHALGSKLVHDQCEGKVEDTADTGSIKSVHDDSLHGTTTKNFAFADSSLDSSKSTETAEVSNAIPPSLLYPAAVKVDPVDTPIELKVTSGTDCFPIPPPPPPPPGSKKKKSRRSKDHNTSTILRIPPPPPEKLKQWKKSKDRRIEYLGKMTSKSIDSAKSFASNCDSESRAISQDPCTSNDDASGLREAVDEALRNVFPINSSNDALQNLEAINKDDARTASILLSFVDEMKHDDASAQSTLNLEKELLNCILPPEASITTSSSKDELGATSAKVVDESISTRTEFQLIEEAVDEANNDERHEIDASLSSECLEVIDLTIDSPECSNSVVCTRSVGDVEVKRFQADEPKKRIVIDLTNEPELDVANDPEAIRRLWSSTSSNDPETLRHAFSVVSVASTLAPGVSALDTPISGMVYQDAVQGSVREMAGEGGEIHSVPTSFRNAERDEIDNGDDGGDHPLEQGSLESHRQVFPSNGECAFDAAIEVDPSILSAILNYLGDPVAVCRTKMLNRRCREYVDDHEHTLMRDAVRLGGMNMSVRPAFWLWVVLSKGCTTASSSLADMDNEDTICQASQDRNFSDLERHGREGKWHHVIERDVSRAFGTLPPHKTGARLRTDSIVRALVSWGRSRLVGRGVKGNRDERVGSRGDESTHSDDVSISPTDTVSDWGGVTPVGSFNGSFASSQSDQMATGAEVGTNPSKSGRKKKKKSKKRSLSTEEEYALGANMLTDDMKASLQRKLSFILHALAAANPEVGYCQGMDYLVAHLLRMLQDTIRWQAVHGNLPAIVRSSTVISKPQTSKDEALTEMYAIVDQSLVVEETIFLVMDSFLTSYGLQHFYWPELRCLKTCCRVFEKIIQMKLPVLADHFEHHELNVGLFALGWFQTLFLYLPSMPSATVCHMWDIWLVERSFKIFFRVGTAILFLSQPILLNHELEGMMGYLNTFPDATLLSPDILIACSLQIKITNRMLMELEQEVKDFPLTC